MKPTWLALAVLALVPLSVSLAPSAAAPAAVKRFEVDTAHSAVLFRIKHLGTSWTYGRFDKFSGKVSFDEADPKGSQVELTVEAASVNTGHEGRDEHLRSPDFLNVAEFPNLTFKSKEVKKGADKGKFSVTGDLSLHGVTKSVSCDFEHIGSSNLPNMGPKSGWEGTFTLKRSDFGMKFMLEGIGDEVRVTISLEGNEQK